VSFDLRDLYQDVILDHGKKPRNARVIEDATFTQPAYNPLCGDKGTLYLTMDSTGQKIAEALKTFGLFHDMITAPPDEATHRAVEDLGKLSVFSGVAEFPARVKCATLAWHALKAALTEGPAAAPVSTE
jgi:nitrogen fixation NifU-like protein